ncbi:MAG: CoA-binding protein [Candidatus Krumholzibacteriia bacterium]
MNPSSNQGTAGPGAGGAVPQPDDARLRRLFESMRRIVVVGLSPKPERASHGIARFLIGQGFDVVGVNPAHDEILGVPVYRSLADVPGDIDVVDVFRRSDEVEPIVEQAVQRRVGFIWLQEGVVNDAAARAAHAAGIEIIMDRCIYQEWLRLMNA